MARPKKENKEEAKVLSWRVEASFAELFDKVFIAAKDRTKADTLRRLVLKEAKRLGISSQG